MNYINHQQHKPTDQQGFTIIELLIATAVFSVVLLIATVAVITVTNSYVKGDVDAETQDTARAVLTTITQDIQFNNNEAVDTGSYDATSGFGFFCIANNVYFYRTNTEIGPNPHALIVIPSTPCPPNPTGAEWASPTVPISTYEGYITTASKSNNFHELLAQNMRLGEVVITAPAQGATSYTVNVVVAYGTTVIGTPDSKGSGYTYDCPNVTGGAQFCAVSTLTTTITPRIQL